MKSLSEFLAHLRNEDYLFVREQDCAKNYEATGRVPEPKKSDNWPKTVKEVAECCEFFTGSRFPILLDIAGMDGMASRFRAAIERMHLGQFRSLMAGPIDNLPSTFAAVAADTNHTHTHDTEPTRS